ncbi:MAG: ABC transporter permease subunit [Dehalococcoidia bacterium]
MMFVYKLTLRQLSGRWRLLITLLLAGLPVTMGVIWRVIEGDARPDSDFEGFAINGMLAGSIIPLVTLAISSAAFSNEIEDKTLANLTLSPIARWKIVVPKLLGAMTIAGFFMMIAAFATGYIAYSGDMTAALAITAGAAVAVSLYASVFILVGLVTTKAIGFGLLYVFLWEGLFAGFVSGVRFLSIRHYSLTIVNGVDDRIFADGEHLSFTVAIVASASVFVIFLALAIVRLRRMDVP